jgi:hypothetical protein
MDTQAKLDAIEEQKQAVLEMSPAQHEAKNAAKLYADVLEAKSTEKNAPFRVKATEKKYYEYRYGEDGYKQHLVDRYMKDGRTLRNEMLSHHNTQLDQVNQAMSYYESVRVYLRNMSEVQANLLTRIKILLDKIRTSKVETNYRKSYFMEQVQTTLSTRIVLCNIFILLYIAWVGLQRADQLTNPAISGTLVVLFLTVFGLSFILRGFAQLPLSVNVYTEFGYDPIESKQPWYFIIPLGMVALWVLVKYLS